MKWHNGLGTILGVFLFFSGVVCAETIVVSGSISGINLDRGRLEVAAFIGGTFEFAVAERTPINRGGKPIKISDLRVGQTVTVSAEKKERKKKDEEAKVEKNEKPKNPYENLRATEIEVRLQ